MATRTRTTNCGVKLAALLAFGAGKLGEEIFIDAAEHVLGFLFFASQSNPADQIDQFAQAGFIEGRAAIFFGQDVL
jgi:hypothetical protein